MYFFFVSLFDITCTCMCIVPYNVDNDGSFIFCVGCGICGCTTSTLNGTRSTNIRIKTRTFKEQTVNIVELKIYHVCMYMYRLNIFYHSIIVRLLLCTFAVINNYVKIYKICLAGSGVCDLWRTSWH